MHVTLSTSRFVHLDAMVVAQASTASCVARALNLQDVTVGNALVHALGGSKQASNVQSQSCRASNRQAASRIFQRLRKAQDHKNPLIWKYMVSGSPHLVVPHPRHLLNCKNGGLDEWQSFVGIQTHPGVFCISSGAAAGDVLASAR